MHGRIYTHLFQRTVVVGLGGQLMTRRRDMKTLINEHWQAQWDCWAGVHEISRATVATLSGIPNCHSQRCLCILNVFCFSTVFCDLQSYNYSFPIIWHWGVATEGGTHCYRLNGFTHLNRRHNRRKRNTLDYFFRFAGSSPCLLGWCLNNAVTASRSFGLHFSWWI